MKGLFFLIYRLQNSFSSLKLICTFGFERLGVGAPTCNLPGRLQGGVNGRCMPTAHAVDGAPLAASGFLLNLKGQSTSNSTGQAAHCPREAGCTMVARWSQVGPVSIS